jgi:guanine deaminase
MDRNSPANYIEPSPQTSVDDTKTLISYIHNLSRPEHGQSNHRIESYSPTHSLVHPIITPRFAISCTDELLRKLGDLAKTDLHLRIQTHVSENAGEIAFTQELFSDAASYTAVYDDRGLLRDNTVLAHAVHLGRDEMELIAKRRAGISHCPTSNFNLRSGLARVGEMLDAGIKVCATHYYVMHLLMLPIGWPGYRRLWRLFTIYSHCNPACKHVL